MNDCNRWTFRTCCRRGSQLCVLPWQAAEVTFSEYVQNGRFSRFTMGNCLRVFRALAKTMSAFTRNNALHALCISVAGLSRVMPIYAQTAGLTLECKVRVDIVDEYNDGRAPLVQKPAAAIWTVNFLSANRAVMKSSEGAAVIVGVTVTPSAYILTPEANGSNATYIDRQTGAFSQNESIGWADSTSVISQRGRCHPITVRPKF